MLRLISLLKAKLKSSVAFLVYKRYRSYYDDSQLQDFVMTHYERNHNNWKSIKRSMKRCYLFGGVNYSEYLVMHFEQRNIFEKKEFVPRCSEMNLYWQVNPKEKYGPLLENKGKCYSFFCDYYKRDLVSVSKKEISEGLVDIKLSSFICKHKKFMVKPLNLYCGIDIQIIDAFESKSIVSDLVASYPNGFVLEELIVQSDSMSSFHPNSVNTIRIVTVNYGDSIDIKWPFMRVGRGGAVVDNAGAGGIIVAIDAETGTTVSSIDEMGCSFVVHPDTKVPLLGFKIPFWEELCELTKKMASMCPDCHVMGWDMALTDSGWVMVECNYGPNNVYQYAVGGMWKEFRKIRKKLGAQKYVMLKQYDSNHRP